MGVSVPHPSQSCLYLTAPPPRGARRSKAAFMSFRTSGSQFSFSVSAAEVCCRNRLASPTFSCLCRARVFVVVRRTLGAAAMARTEFLARLVQCHL